MDVKVKGFTGLNVTNSRIDGLMADFSGMEKLEEVVDKVLRRISYSESVQYGVKAVERGVWSRSDFDGWFSELVRKELGKTLAIVRANTVKKAMRAGGGSASSGVTWHQSREGNRGYVGITSPKKRISSRRRVVPESNGGASGIRRQRTVDARTKKINEYFGPDRHFILRFLEFGTDIRTAKPSGPSGRGSKATYGRRGNISPRSFMHNAHNDMELAAQQLGETLVGHVERWIDTKFKNEE